MVLLSSLIDTRKSVGSFIQLHYCINLYKTVVGIENFLHALRNELNAVAGITKIRHIIDGKDCRAVLGYDANALYLGKFFFVLQSKNFAREKVLFSPFLQIIVLHLATNFYS